MSRLQRASRSVGPALAISLAAATLSGVASTPAQATDWSRQCVRGSADRQAVFDRAAATSGVPRQVLLGVSFMESRWDDHGSAPSTSAGYGPMHLTSPAGIERAPAEHPMGKGDGHRSDRPARMQVERERIGKDALSTLAKAAALTGISQGRLKSDAVANVCGGAAVLAHYQREAGGARDLGDWSAAVARYSGADEQAGALRFARQVFRTIRSGVARTTNDGQRVVLAPHSSARVDTQAVEALGLAVVDDTVPDCPARLGCEWYPAPYEHYGSTPGDYGNHDLANRPVDGPDIDYIVMHDTEATYNTTLQLVSDPEYVSWHYTIRSADGHIAQHVANHDVAWHAGNWYVNMHSIGIEQEGFAVDGAQWYTESLYRNSARLVEYLAKKYDVTLDRAHIIGHDQVPGTVPGTVAGMHWDPGPFWDWEHYFKLLGASIKPSPRPGSTVVTVKPGFDDNVQPVTGCVPDAPTAPCGPQGTNFVYLHTQPDLTSPLVTDVGLKPTGAPSTTNLSDIGARAAAGQQLVVAAVQGDWTEVWWLGNPAWVYNPQADRTLVPSHGQVVTTASTTAVPVYGRAYPEQTAYPTGIPYQTVTPLQYSIQPGQSYVLADDDIQTDYYRATTFNCSVQPDCIDVVGADQYYEIWFGHRIAYVRAVDVTVADGVVTPS